MLTAAATTHSVNSSREPVLRHLPQQPREQTRRPTSSISATKAATLARVIGQRRTRALPPPASAGWPPSDAGERRQQHQHQHHRQVLDHQPADGDAAVAPIERAARSRAPSAAPRCWPPTAPGRTPAPPPERPAPEQRQRRRPARSRPPSARWRRAARSLRTASRSASEKCRPTPNISSMTPISASCAGDRRRRRRSPAWPGR